MNGNDVGRLLLRLAVGGMMLLHGVSKLSHGIDKIVENVRSHGLPTPFAYGVYLGEVVAPILLVLGLWTRPAGLVIAFNMIVAVYLAHLGDIGTLNKGGGWSIELQAFYFIGAVCVALLGAGRISVRKGSGKLD